MKVAIYTISFSIIICQALEDGKFVPDNSGQYVPDDEGRYVPDDSGRYIPDYSGLYHPDGSGKYFDDGSGRYRDSLGIHNRNQLLLSGSHVTKKFVKPNLPLATSLVNKDNIKLGRYDDKRWQIIRQNSDVDNEGYRYEYETENEISAKETGILRNVNTDSESLQAKGFYKYTGPNNIVYSIAYTADKNGFIPDGEHLPVGIQRALAHITKKN